MSICFVNLLIGDNNAATPTPTPNDDHGDDAHEHNHNHNDKKSKKKKSSVAADHKHTAKEYKQFARCEQLRIKWDIKPLNTWYGNIHVHSLSDPRVFNGLIL
jgi:hypothetical protein